MPDLLAPADLLSNQNMKKVLGGVTIIYIVIFLLILFVSGLDSLYHVTQDKILKRGRQWRPTLGFVLNWVLS